MSKNFCASCREPLDDDARFCEGCGVEVAQQKLPIQPLHQQPLQYQQSPPHMSDASLQSTGMRYKKSALFWGVMSAASYALAWVFYFAYLADYNLAFFWISFIFGLCGIVEGIVAIIFASKSKRNGVRAIPGFVLGIIFSILCVIDVLMMLSYFFVNWL